MTQMNTFKYVHDARVDYGVIARRLYGENKCTLSPMEGGKQDSRDHLHFIGYSERSKDEFKKELEKRKEEHP